MSPGNQDVLRRGPGDDDERMIMKKGPDGIVRQLKDRLRSLCNKRRIRLQEFFKPFDVHHHKKISRAQFQRGLDQAGVMAPAGGAPPSDLLNAKEVGVLAKRYAVQGGAPGQEAEVNYWKLCEQVEKAFTRRGLEKNPTLEVKLSLQGRPESRYGVRGPGLSVEEVEIVGALLSRIRLLGATEGLIVKALFETFDKRHSGRVTSTVFLRQLDSMFKGRLSKVEARLLLKAYQTRDGNVNYRTMHADCAHGGKHESDGGFDARGVSVQVLSARRVDDQLQQQREQEQQQQEQRHRMTENRHMDTAHGGDRVMGGSSGNPVGTGVTDGNEGVEDTDRTRIDNPSDKNDRGSDIDDCKDDDDDDDDDSSSIVSSVTGFPGRGVVGFSVGEKGSSGRGQDVGGGISSELDHGTGGAREERDVSPASRTVRGTLSNVQPRDSLPIERQMASKVMYHRLLPEDAFTPYDPTRSGMVTVSVFRRGLSDAFRMPFNDAQLNALSGRYCCSEEKVDYRRMCEYIYAVADKNSLDRRLKRLEHQHSHEEDVRDDKIVGRALEKIRTTLARRRLFLQPGFQDFDRKGEGHVSVGQMERVLCSYGVLPPDNETKELLTHRYAAADDPHHPGGIFISYRPFLEDLGEGPRGSPGGCLPIGREGRDPRFKGFGGQWDDDHDNNSGSLGGGGSASCSTSVATSQSRVFGKPTGLQRPAHSVVSEVDMTSSVVLGRSRDRGVMEIVDQLKEFAFRSRLRTQDFFRSDDPLRSGTMNRERFGRGLLSTGFRFSPVELEAICDAYADDTLVDKGGSPYVRYAALVEEVEGVFGVRRLEREPQCNVDASIEAAQATFTSRSPGGIVPESSRFTQEDDSMVMETLRELGWEIHRRRLNLHPALRDFDRFNRGVVPGTMFERALSAMGLLPGRRKSRLLRRKFAERFSSPDARSDVNYRAFLSSIDLAMAGHQKVPDGLLMRANDSKNYSLGIAAFGEVGTNINKAVEGTQRDGSQTTSTDSRSPCLSRQSVVREVARQLARGEANVADFLSDADRLKQGEVSLPKLKVALALAGVNLTDEELHILEAGYRSDRNGDMVDWRRLSAAVNGVGQASFATCWNGEVFDPLKVAQIRRGRKSCPPQGHAHRQQQQPREFGEIVSMDPVGIVERIRDCQHTHSSGCSPSVVDKSNSSSEDSGDPTEICPDAITTRTQLQAASGPTPGSSGEDAVDEELLRKALDAVRHRVKHYRMSLKPCFQDFDPNRKKRITPEQFLSVLGNMNLSLSEQEQQAICRRYTVHERSPGVRVRYEDFCGEISLEFPQQHHLLQ